MRAQGGELKVALADGFADADEFSDCGLGGINSLLSGVGGNAFEERGDGDDCSGLEPLRHTQKHRRRAGANANDGRPESAEAFEVGQSRHEAFVDRNGKHHHVAGRNARLAKAELFIAAEAIQIGFSQWIEGGNASCAAGGADVDERFAAGAPELIVEF